MTVWLGREGVARGQAPPRAHPRQPLKDGRGGQWAVAGSPTASCAAQLGGPLARRASAGASPAQAWVPRAHPPWVMRFAPAAPVHRFHVTVAPGTKLESGPATLHLCNDVLVLARDIPPAVVGQWKLPDLRRYGAVPSGFIFEGGTRCGYCKYVVAWGPTRGNPPRATLRRPGPGAALLPVVPGGGSRGPLGLQSQAQGLSHSWPVCEVTERQSLLFRLNGKKKINGSILRGPVSHPWVPHAENTLRTKFPPGHISHWPPGPPGAVLCAVGWPGRGKGWAWAPGL